MSKPQLFSLATTLVATLLCGSLGLAQDPPKPADDALERLLEKLEGPKDDGDKPATEKKQAEVAPSDKDLDSLLEKLGQTTDAPTPEDQPKRVGPGLKIPPPPADQAGKGKGSELKGDAKGLDEHLEELTGRSAKKKDRKQEQGEPSGPLSKVIKEMRDVEQRLGKTDTGEETRKRQSEIVKNLEGLIEQMRESQSQSQSKKKAQLSMKPANQPGSKGGQEQGAMAKGTGASKPERPTDKHANAGGKDEWGHLPAELRQQMVNIFKEEGLPNKAEHIRRYYLSLSKKILTREE
ncbi:hypothetical protein [Singulisphaera acidiphila]|uniref:Uncharacterized protein n=1 Tax=Singulisphaera acidiphila (strain ATCC BAA-1392 / DSM 18658 / VKM B-2454 / MOB10) TaxID=886293 RepID=L0DC05_SINAD|nr:hypothetical protein [Singulisphaera acidiphila]AGA26206.1 hypothetical protein Sinac_1841 [Singulisphaera acidiphila DSM 18658]